MIKKSDKLYQVNITHPKQRLRVSRFLDGNNCLATYAIPFIMLENFIYLYRCNNICMVVELK